MLGDRSAWHFIQAPEEIFVLRKFDYDALFLLQKWLRLKRSNLKIVEMGSGSGYFTEKLLKISNNPSIICVEPDDALREYAQKRLGKRVVFLKGFVENPPIPKDTADLVICHYLLCNVPDVHSALKGMIRVAKPGGFVCSIEPLFMKVYSTDPRVKLIVDGYSANIEGAWKKRKELVPYPEEDPNRNYKYPAIFAACGLARVEMHVLAVCHFDGDCKWTREDQIEHSKNWLNLLRRHRERYMKNLRRMGWDSTKIEAFFKAWQGYHTDIIQSSDKLAKDQGVYIICKTVTIGQKKNSV
jgi:SAM-dependent methyltransferase